MPYYDVHLFKLYREKYRSIDAVDMQSAIAACVDHPAVPDEVEDAEEPPVEALVDVVGDDEYMQTARFDLTYTDSGAVQPVATTASTTLSQRAVALIETIARLTKDGDIVDGEEYEAQGNDDDVDALYSLISTARELLGWNDIYTADQGADA